MKHVTEWKMVQNPARGQNLDLVWDRQKQGFGQWVTNQRKKGGNSKRNFDPDDHNFATQIFFPEERIG